MALIQQEKASGMGDANAGGGARVIYLYSSPLVQQNGGRTARMVQLGTKKVCLQTQTENRRTHFIGT